MFGSSWCVNFEKIWKTLRLEFCHQKLSTFRTMNFYAFTYSPDLGSLFYPWFDEGCTFYGTFWISLLCLKSHFLYFWFTLVSVSQMWKSQDILEVNCVDLTLSILILLRTEFLWPRLCVFVRKAGRK